MDLYVKFSFWIGVAATVFRLCDMAASQWPKVREPKSLGLMAAETIIGLAFTIWAGLALWIL